MGDLSLAIGSMGGKGRAGVERSGELGCSARCSSQAATAILLDGVLFAPGSSMRRLVILVVPAALLALAACGGSNNKKATSPTAAGPTAPPAQTAAPAQAQRGSPTPGVSLEPPGAPPKAVTDITEQVRPKPGGRSPGFGFGQFEAYQPNEAAVSGFENPAAVLDLMNTTGRLGGYLRQITTPDSPGGAGVTIDVWKDAAGAKQYFDQYPRPAAGTQYQEITLPQPLGEQSFAIQVTGNGQIGYSIAWRRGRIILGVGEFFLPDKASLDALQPLIDLLDQKAQAAQQ